MEADVVADVEAAVTSEFLLQWHITERCNLHCRHCYQEDRPLEDRPLEDLLTICEQYQDLLTHLRRQRTDTVHGNLTITGGEPLLHPDLFPLLEKIRHHEKRLMPCRVAILTNGTQIDRETASRFAQMELRYVQVSIDGTQPTHDAIRGPGSFEAAVRGIQELVRHNVITIISMTVHRENFREFPEVVRLGQKLKVRKVWSDRHLPFGRGGTLQPLDKNEVREWLEIMSQTKSKAERRFFSKTEVALDRALQSLVPGGQPYRCTAGKTLLAVGAQGEVYPCRRMPHNVGNLFETSLIDIYNQSPFLQKLRDDATPIPGCTGCRHFSHCGGGLRCYSYAQHGSPFHSDPGCFYAEEP